MKHHVGIDDVGRHQMKNSGGIIAPTIGFRLEQLNEYKKKKRHNGSSSRTIRISCTEE